MDNPEGPPMYCPYLHILSDNSLLIFLFEWMRQK